ncbi:MAG: addiction module protein [Planctomycetales bacterium]|nr:addiction module protein [Planctomycetales bacterium]
MEFDVDALLALPKIDKMRIVELLWDNLANDDEPIPIPDWVRNEARRRSEELASDPSIGLTHEEVWSRIGRRHG